MRWLGYSALALSLTGVAVPVGARAWRYIRVQRAIDLVRATTERLKHGDDAPPSDEIIDALTESGGDGDAQEILNDDPRARQLANLALFGPQSPEFVQYEAEVAAEEARRWARLMPGPKPRVFAALSGNSWANLGPTYARYEWNGSGYVAVDSGRPTAIRVDPSDATGNTAYLATCGGGVWKTYNMTAATPSWQPFTDNLQNLAIGAMDVDPTAPTTLYIGTGDAFDTSGGAVYKTTDGGATWSAPVFLTGTYANGVVVHALSVRWIMVDGLAPASVWATTDVGLFHSADGGTTWALVTLPSANSSNEEATWDMAYLGKDSTSGQSAFLVSGVMDCGPNRQPPPPGYGVPAGVTSPVDNASCTNGNLGDIWRTTDGGTTFTSSRALGLLPNLTGGTGGIGRVALGAGGFSAQPPSAANAGLTTVFGMAEDIDERYYQGALNNATSGIIRTTSGGGSAWANVTGSIANPTTSSDCNSMDVGHGQSWYNLVVQIDPQNANNVLMGGNLCSVRSLTGLNATPTWENVSHWLPSGGGGNVTGGTLPYVHADWHAIVVTRQGGTLRALAGTDGGFFMSANVFTAGVTPPNVAWAQPDTGLATHLLYSVGSGDPSFGNQHIVLAGAQDNGTRFRDHSDNPTPTTFNQPLGGDGFGTTVISTSTGTNVIVWTSVYGNSNHYYCKPADAVGTLCDTGGAFTASDPTMPCYGTGLNKVCDVEPFIARYSPVLTNNNSSILTIGTYNVFRSSFTPTWTQLTPFTSTNRFNFIIRNVYASQVTDGLYGVAGSGGHFATTSGCTAAVAPCTWTTAASRLGVGTATNQYMLYANMVAFPTNPASLGGSSAVNTYLAASGAPVMADGVTPVPSSIGHLFKTIDGGTTWIPFHGNGTGYDLPNVPIQIVRYDPGDATDQTIFVGSDVGMYRSTDGGNTWYRYGVGLPTMRITDAYVARNGSMLRVSTYGRGVWEIYPNDPTPGMKGNGDWDRNNQLDFIDLAAMAARLGTTPATVSTPYYDRADDMVDPSGQPVNTIDENDLTQFLGVYGSHP